MHPTVMTTPRPFKRQRPAFARGFSLVELLVALTIGLILLTLLAVIFSNTSLTQKENTLSAQQIENGRTAMDILGDDLHHAGFWGYYATAGTAPASLPNPCDVSVANLRTSMALPVQGYNNPTSSPLSCLQNANYLAGTDILVVRHASTIAATTLAGNVTYIQSVPSTLTSPVVDTGSNSANFTLQVRNGTGANVAAPIRAFKVHVYFISPCSVPANGSTCASTDDGGAPIPTLKRLELDTSTGAITTVPLVEGIENLQVDYGIDSDGDGAPDGGTSAYVANPGSVSVADWQKVMSVQVYVLARNTQSSVGYTDNKTYPLGTSGTFTPPTSTRNYRRHVYTGAVRIKNPSERLATL